MRVGEMIEDARSIEKWSYPHQNVLDYGDTVRVGLNEDEMWYGVITAIDWAGDRFLIDDEDGNRTWFDIDTIMGIPLEDAAEKFEGGPFDSGHDYFPATDDDNYRPAGFSHPGLDGNGELYEDGSLAITHLTARWRIPPREAEAFLLGCGFFEALTDRVESR